MGITKGTGVPMLHVTEAGRYSPKCSVRLYYFLWSCVTLEEDYCLVHVALTPCCCIAKDIPAERYPHPTQN